ncbi:MAG TPA: universal stress protein [Polyangiaceae bacterium LLY-WYZ-14_1]|nr:universal stress protein [Polyangiaceae bacterium LLY-WYZ-14_1]
MPEIKNILCPIDFSDTSLSALDYGIDLATTLGAEVHVMHAYQLPVYALPDGALMASPEYITDLSNKLQAELDKVVDARQDRGPTLQAHLVEGVPHDEVARLGERIGADLVVMGTQGRSGLGHWLLGSVAEKVVRSSEVPVLTVRQPKK